VSRLVSRLILGAAAAVVSWSVQANLEPITDLEMSERHPVISQSVTKLIEEFHYSRQRLDNSLSSAVLDQFLDTLDRNRVYFLASDIATFGKYRYEMDDRARSGELEPVYEVFNLFRERVQQRVAAAITLLDTAPDYTLDEDYRWDRTELSWPTTEEDMQEIWRLRVKSDGLGLVMAEESWEEAADTLRTRYERINNDIAALTADDVFETFMNSVAHTMDPHSNYLSPRQSQEYRIEMSLSYEGIGATLQSEDELVRIINIIPGGPAALDGELKPEDRITAVGEGIDGELVDVVGWRLQDVVERIRGPGGTTIRLQVLPATQPPGSPQKIVNLVRDKVKLEEQAANSELLEIPMSGQVFKIGVITVPKFYQDFEARSRGEEDYTSTSRDVARLVAELETQGIDGIVMDLRQNGGGHLSEATELSGLFIDRGPVVQLRETRGNIEVLDDPSDSAIYTGPLAVLVDRYSASASEIFAAAIQDYERGIIIGQQTFGKGSVQNLFNLDRMMRGTDNGQLTLTIGKYYRVTGESTQNRGVFPDIELPSDIRTESVGESTRDTALPWDRIQPTRFRAEAPLDGEIALLSDRLRVHSAEDPDFNFLVGEIAARTENWDQHTVSLNLDNRRSEQDAASEARLQRENARRTASGLEPIETLEDIEESVSAAEILLEQAARTVAEMAIEARSKIAQRSSRPGGSEG
jgi:carboxyl-terminal processing protease